jgi:hypothetical protein
MARHSERSEESSPEGGDLGRATKPVTHFLRQQAGGPPPRAFQVELQPPKQPISSKPQIRHPERSEGSTPVNNVQAASWILRCAQNDEQRYLC